MFADTVKQFSDSELLPSTAKWDLEHTFVKELIAKAVDLGLSRLYSSIIFEQLFMGKASMMIANWATSVAKNACCSNLSTGGKLTSYCLTEPGSWIDAEAIING